MSATLHHIHGERGDAKPRERGRPAGSSLQAVHQFLLAWKPGAACWRSPLGSDRALRALAALDDDDIGNLSEIGRRLRLQARQQLRTAEANGRLCRTDFRLEHFAEKWMPVFQKKKRPNMNC